MTRPRKLAGRVAIVTGAGSKPSPSGAFGTGRAIAVLFAQEGAQVVLVDRHEDRANLTLELIENAGGSARVVVADLSDAATCDAVVGEAVAAFGRLDVLVNNAFAFTFAGLLDTSEDDFRECVSTNLVVPFLLSKAAVPAMIEAGGGAIVNISTIATTGGAGPIAYAASKAGLGGLTTSVATEFGPQGVRMNTILVGGITTPQQQLKTGGGPTGRTVSGVAGDAWDIAHATLFLASAESRHLTGVSVPVDGGATIVRSPMPGAAH